MFNIIKENYSTNIINELHKHLESGALEGEIMTLCDLRRKVEAEYGVGIFTNEEILKSIVLTAGFFTSRVENETGDMCYVEWSEIKIYLNKLLTKRKISGTINI